MKKNLLKHLAVLAIFFLLAVLFFWPFIVGEIGFIWDTKVFGFGNLNMVTRYLSQGEFLLWNPFHFSGYPFMGNIEVGLFYPVNWLWALLFGEMSFSSLPWYFVIHYWIGAFFAYLICFKLTKNTLASFTGGAIYAYSGYALGHISHMGQDIMYMWVPIVFLAFIFALEKRTWFYTLLAGTAFGAAILIGHYNTSVYLLLGLFIFTIFRLVENIKDKKKLWKISLHALTATVFALFVSAILVLPVAELAFQSNRSSLTYEQQSENWSLHAGDLAGLVNPNHNHILDENPLENFDGSVDITQNYFYIGLIPLLLIGIALFSKWKYKWFFVTFGAVCLLAAFGKYTPVNYILFKLFPGFSKARMAVQIMGMVYLSAAVIASVGATSILKIKKIKKVAPIVLAIIGLLVVSDIFYHGFNKRFYSETLTSNQNIEQLKFQDARVSDEANYLSGHQTWQYFGIENVWGTSGIRIKKYDDLFDRGQTSWKPINETLYDFLNVKHIIRDGNDIQINEDVLPRAYLVQNYKVVEEQKALEVIKNGEVNFRDEVLLNKEPVYLGETGETTDQQNVEIIEQNPSYLKINATVLKQSILVTSEVDYNGWKLYVDGDQQEYLNANYTFRAVALNPGEHIIEFKYKPASFFIGALISFLSICLLIFMGIKNRNLI